MTSLFRRSSSNGSSRNSSSNNSSQELNNSRPARQVRRLEFNQAMKDFKTMFPNMDYDVIECVLRSNNGAVDATIDQLLQMNFDHGYDDSSDSDDSIPQEILERTLEPDSSDEEPPPVYSPPSYDMHIYDRQYPLQTPPTPPPRFDVQSNSTSQTQRRYRNWNPPLLGNLPDDFLRILPQQMDSVKSSQSMHQLEPQGSSQNSQRSLDQERKLRQYLEDERIALFLQNEEFMKELQRNHEFLLALERDRLKYESKKSKSLNSAGSADGSWTATLPATRKKLFELARAFSEKTKMRKPKRKQLLKHQSLGTAASTANLLDDVEGNSCDEDLQLKKQSLQETEEEEEEEQKTEGS
ncbi:CUE domain-containing protein 1 isoform X2 [Protopterus annectens]|uniref:CUE domain-containing protein 1 isoform X2 n=1 Tax=Protopterus annectens TaxID=7888 RepID=UPI001CFA212C|nr:CUE domain-containing protein 1 isoform X2 [Protopterus annectens]